ncbi:MAG TPA: efflux transporter outer membrane subunit [Rhodocyclaceae bacterium]|nr:efflux transporter outer membrane subunit [Rhodocyclaceae bacterium]
MKRTCISLACLFLLNGCALGPDFLRPKVAVPEAYREAEGWKLAEPREDALPAAWWEAFGDPVLNGLAAQVEISNQNVLAAAAQFRQAQALAAGAHAARFPTVGTSLSSTRSQGASGTTVTPGAPVRTADRFSLTSSWEADLWGRLGRAEEANAEAAQASAADLAAARLSAQASLAQNYLLLRINDAQQRLLTRTIAAYQRSWEITRNRYQAGVASQADVAQAEAQLKTTQAQAVDLGVQRSQLEHAIALLLGRLPSEFRLAPVEALPALPRIPLALPSALLERRPDVAAAERRVAAANAQIGVAQAAFFPTLTLSANGGYQNSEWANLLATSHRFWSLGPSLALTLFDAGARAAQKDQAVAAYDRTVATYRQTVLAAFQEVEDNLAALRILEEEKDIQLGAAKAADQFRSLTENQYQAGTVSFLNVAIAQASALTAERSSLDILGRQLAASVGLLRSLGGGDWREKSAPTAAPVLGVQAK